MCHSVIGGDLSFKRLWTNGSYAELIHSTSKTLSKEDWPRWRILCMTSRPLKTSISGERNTNRSEVSVCISVFGSRFLVSSWSSIVYWSQRKYHVFHIKSSELDVIFRMWSHMILYSWKCAHLNEATISYCSALFCKDYASHMSNHSWTSYWCNVPQILDKPYYVSVTS